MQLFFMPVYALSPGSLFISKIQVVRVPDFGVKMVIFFVHFIVLWLISCKIRIRDLAQVLHIYLLG